MRRVLMAAVATALMASGTTAGADPIQRVETDSLSISFAVPDWIAWPPDFQPCGPAPLYNFSFGLERVTHISNADEPIVEYSVSGGDGGCERGSAPYTTAAGPITFDIGPLGNSVHVVIDLTEGDECCNHFDFMLTRPSSINEADCVASVLCANVWTDQQSFGVKAGVAFERRGYVLTLTDYTFLTEAHPDSEILELSTTLTRSVAGELTNPV